MLYSMPLTGSTPEDEIQEILEHILPPEDLNRYGFSFVVPKTPDSFESLESLLVKHKIHEPLLVLGYDFLSYSFMFFTSPRDF